MSKDLPVRRSPEMLTIDNKKRLWMAAISLVVAVNIGILPILAPAPISAKTNDSEFKLMRSLNVEFLTDSLEVTADGKTLVSNSRILSRDISDDSGAVKISIWRLADGKLLHTLDDPQMRAAAKLSPDGKTIITTGRKPYFGGDGVFNIKIWSTATGKLLRTIPDSPIEITSIAMSPDGQTIIKGDAEGTIKILRFNDGKLLQTLSGHQNSINSIIVNRNSGNIVSGSSDGTIKVWRLADGKLLNTIPGYVECLAVSPDGRTIAGGSSNAIRIWRLTDGQIIRTIDEESLRSLAFSSDSQNLIVAGQHTKIWRLTDGKLLQTIHTITKGDRRSDDILYPYENSQVISPDRRTIITSREGVFGLSSGGFIDIWRRR
jgi:WD40 repeat protein